METYALTLVPEIIKNIISMVVKVAKSPNKSDVIKKYKVRTRNIFVLAGRTYLCMILTYRFSNF